MAELRSKTLHDVGWASVGELHEAYVSEMEENERLRKVLDDIYPAIAGRAMLLKEAGELNAFENWSAYARQIYEVRNA